MAEERLTDEEVARVLRRASQLDVSPGALAAGGGLPLAALEAAAAEVGLSPAAVRQAVAELRAGALDHDVDTVGFGTIVCARVVPGSCADSLAALGRWLEGQAMVRARDRVTEQVWRPREDWVAGLQRRFDVTAAIRLKAVDEVVTRAVEVDGGTLVRIVATLNGAVAVAPRIGGGIGAVAGAAAFGWLGLLLGDPAVLAGAAGMAAGGAAAGTAGWRVGRRVRAGERHRVTEAVDGLLDELEQGRQPNGRSPLDRLASRARRLRGGWSA